MSRAALEGREGRQAGETAEAEEVRLDRRPTRAFGLRDREDDRAEARRCEHSAPEVETPPARLRGVGGDDLQCGDRECCGDGEVDVEDHPPVGELGQHAADEDADRSTCAADGSPRGERLRTLAALERGHDDRERCRGEHRGAEPLACTSGEEGAGGAGHRRGERGGGEDAEAGQEHPASSEQVGGAAAEEEQAAEDQRVARDRPADAGAGQVQVTGEAWQRDVHGGDVEDHHQLCDQQDEEQQTALRRSVPSRWCPCRRE